MRRPNLLLVVADDLGYSDLGVMGSEIRTPHLDALARSGLLLTNFHVSPACSPTRAMLLSGTDNHPAGLGTMSGEWDDNQKGRPGYEAYLSDRVVSVASLLRDAGYHTYMVGKWHLGEEPGQGPDRRGFERSFVLLSGGASHFADATPLVEGSEPAPYREDGRPVDLPDDFYSSRFYTDRLMDYIRGGLPDARPFFAYAAYTAPHWPLQVPEDSIDSYHGAYDPGWDVLRARRLAKLKAMGFVPEEIEEPARIAFAPAWESLSAEEKRTEARKMELFSAMVEKLDENVGRLLDFLEAVGELDNTFIMFFSDNGAEGNPIENLHNNAEWIPRRFDNSYENMGRRSSYVFYGPGWAQATTAPFRLFKAFPTEGGIRVPAIVSYHRFHPARQTSDVFVSVKDVAPTLLELAGTTHPGRQYEGREVVPIEGDSMLSFLEGNLPSVHGSDYVMGWELFGRRAVRRGDWKLLWLAEPYGTSRWELFNLVRDPLESQDLSGANPEKLRELITLWDGYVEANGVILPTRDMGYANEKTESAGQ